MQQILENQKILKNWKILKTKKKNITQDWTSL